MAGATIARAVAKSAAKNAAKRAAKSAAKRAAVQGTFDEALFAENAAKQAELAAKREYLAETTRKMSEQAEAAVEHAALKAPTRVPLPEGVAPGPARKAPAVRVEVPPGRQAPKSAGEIREEVFKKIDASSEPQGAWSHWWDRFRSRREAGQIKTLKKELGSAQARLDRFDTALAGKAEAGTANAGSKAVAERRAVLEGSVEKAQAKLDSAQARHDVRLRRMDAYAKTRADADAARMADSASRGSFFNLGRNGRWSNGLFSWDPVYGHLGWGGKLGLGVLVGAEAAATYNMSKDLESLREDLGERVRREREANAAQAAFIEKYFSRGSSALGAALADDDAFEKFYDDAANALVSNYNARHIVDPVDRAAVRMVLDGRMRMWDGMLREANPERYRDRIGSLRARQLAGHQGPSPLASRLDYSDYQIDTALSGKGVAR